MSERRLASFASVVDNGVLALLWNYLRRTIYDGGLYEDVKRGHFTRLTPGLPSDGFSVLGVRAELNGSARARPAV